MSTTRLSTKGQLVIPREIRERQGWAAGIELRVEERGGAVVISPVVTVPETSLDELVGCTGYRGPRRSLADMERAVAEEARRRR